MVSARTHAASGTACAGVYPVPTPLVLDGAAWKPHHLFTGRTAGLYSWSAHVSALASGAVPHPPHTHDEEEVLLLLSGEVDIIVPEAPAAGGDSRIPLRSGQFAYYPSRFPHTLQTTGPEAANYLMFRWLNPSGRRSPGGLPFGVFDSAENGPARQTQEGSRAADGVPGGQGQAGPHPAAGVPAAPEPVGQGEVRPGLSSRLVFEGNTAFLPRFHCHISRLAAGCGYQPHDDPYDVGIVLLEGEVETLGRRVEPRAVVTYTAGLAHGMHNPGERAARYLVFEFQGKPTPYWTQFAQRLRRLPRRVRHKARRMLVDHRPGR